MRLILSLFLGFATYAIPNVAPLQSYDFGKVVRVKTAPQAEAAKPRYKIAVIDTGYDPSRATTTAKLCKDGHWDFLTQTPNINFTQEHGTLVTSIIAEKLQEVDYCIIVITITTNEEGIFTGEIIAEALKKAFISDPTVINMSFHGGVDKSEEERLAIEEAAKRSIPLFLSAGNENINLDNNCNVYPQCYKPTGTIILVGAQGEMEPKEKASYSNYGKRVDIWAPGDATGADGHVEHGTSFATPRALAEDILYLESQRFKH